MDSARDFARDFAHLADAKRTAATEIRRIAKTIPVQADRILLVSHAAWLESEAAAFEANAAGSPGRVLALAAGDGQRGGRRTKAA
jgi:hypothetical protein